MAGFSSEEKLDLLYKKVIYGANKSGRSEQFGPASETSSTYTAVLPDYVWKEANSTNVPTTPPSATTAYVQRYASWTSSQPANTTAPVQCVPNTDSPTMDGQSSPFTRSWKTQATNWIGPSFGPGYLVNVWVGPANWDGDETDSTMTKIIFGANQNRDWFFDYEAGMLYWTNENAEATASNTFEDSESFTAFDSSYVVYVVGYRYIGATGVGSSTASTIGISEVDDNVLYHLAFVNANGGATSSSLYYDSDDDGAGTSDYGLTYNPQTNTLTLGNNVSTIALTTGTFGATSVNSDLIPNATNTRILGSSSVNWDKLYLNAGGLYLNGAQVTSSATELNLLTGVTSLFNGDYGSLTNTPTLGTIASQDSTSVDIDGGSIDGTIIGANTAAAGTFQALAATTGTFSSNVSISGNLTVVGEVFQTNSTEVNFNDTILRTNVPTAGATANAAAPSSGITGIEAFNGVVNNSTYVAGAKWVYDYSTDKWKASNQSSALVYDNVKTLKFDATDTNTQVNQANGTTTMPATDEANATSVRSLGAVAKCSIEITTSATDGGTSSNFAPAEAAANGYPIVHNLNTQSVYVFAIKTYAAGSLLADPVPIFCKWTPEDNDTVRVTIGITAEDDQYDIIVVG